VVAVGKKSKLPQRLAAEDEQCFPGLVKAGYVVTSPKDGTYNCVSLAVGDISKKWDGCYYWPSGVSRSPHLDSLKNVCEQQGFEICGTGDLEDGYEKVALYVDNNGFWAHIAKQVGNQWCSKLGDEEDVVHPTPHCFSDSVYHWHWVHFMKRRAPTRQPADSGKT
jgi:hypothetical protein